MTRKDYQLIAEVFKNAIDGQAENSHCQVKDPMTAIHNMAHDMRIKLLRDNPAFNNDKFLKACGIL